MSVQSTPDMIAEVDHSAEFAERLGLDERYTPVVMEPLSGYGPIVDAWLRMQYPLNVDEDGQHGVIQGQAARHAVQYPDGRGVYETTAQARLYAIRTAEGVVVWNDHPGHDHHPYKASVEPQVAVSVPFAFVGAVLTEQTPLDIHDDAIIARAIGGERVDGEEFMRGVVSADVYDGDERGVLLEHADGVQVYVGFDSTAHGDGTFGFVPFNGKEGIRVPSARDALDLLRPDEALAAERRQGEWYFAPVDDDVYPDGTIQKPGVGLKPYGGSPLDSHVPRDWKTAVHDAAFVRRVVEELADDFEPPWAVASCGDCEWEKRYEGEWTNAEKSATTGLSGHCGKTDCEFENGSIETAGIWGVYGAATPQDIFDAIEAGELDLSFGRARELSEGVFVRGSVRHREADHEMLSLGEEWHQAVTHDQEVLSIDDTGRNYHVD